MTDKTEIKEPEGLTEDMLLYLDDLRDAGGFNMFGVAPELADEFGLDKMQSKAVLKYWMQTYHKRHGGSDE